MMNDTAQQICKNQTREEFLKYANKIRITDSLNKDLKICDDSIGDYLSSLIMIPCKTFCKNNSFHIKEKGFIMINFQGINEITQDKILINLIYYSWQSSYFLLIKIENIQVIEENKKLKEIDQYKDRLLANVGHDLRNPLNSIMHLVEKARTEQDQIKRNSSLAFANVNAELLLMLINDILDHSQIKEKKIRFVFENFNICQLIDQTAQLMRIQAKQKHVNIRVLNFIDEFETEIYSDQNRIKQVIINLLSNAIKFTSKGFIDIKLDTFKENYMKFEVIDRGAGIKSENIPQLAQPFSTFDNEMKQNQKGIGLGLNISKFIIKKLGPLKNFYVSSIYGKGTKFGFLLYKNCKHLSMKQENTQNLLKEQLSEIPSSSKLLLKQEHKNFKFKYEENEIFSEFDLQTNDQDECILDDIQENYSGNLIQSINHHKVSQQFKNYSQQNNSIRSPKKNSTYCNLQYHKKITILLVDDNAFNILVLKQQLQQFTYSEFDILEAYNGQEAVDLFEKYNNKLQENLTAQCIDIILMDCMMPILDGFQASEQIFQLIKTGNYQEIKIIGNSAIIDQEEIKRCKEVGMCALLQKPASQKKLFAIIQEQLNQ